MKDQLNSETQEVLMVVSKHVGWFNLQQMLAQETILLTDLHKKDSATLNELHDTIGELKHKIKQLESEIITLREEEETNGTH